MCKIQIIDTEFIRWYLFELKYSYVSNWMVQVYNLKSKEKIALKPGKWHCIWTEKVVQSEEDKVHEKICIF